INETGQVVREKLNAPRLSTPALDPAEKIIILDDGSGRGRSLLGPGPQGQQRLYVQGEWLLWTQRGFHLPPLVTTASANDNPATPPECNTGNLQVRTSSNLWGAEVNSRCCLWNHCDFTLTGLIGFRYLDLNEHLSIEENSVFINDVPAVGAGPPLFNKGDQTF